MPILVITTLLLLAVLARTFLPYRRSIKIITSFVVVAYLALISPIGANLLLQGLTAWLPSNSNLPGDAIVVLGRGEPLRSSRSQVVLQLWHESRASFIFASGQRESLEIAKWLKRQGVPAQFLRGETCSKTTEENAQLTAMALKPLQTTKIILVTDPPHMLRAWLTFRSLGFQVIPHVAALPENISSVDKARVSLSEYVGLSIYLVKGRFRDRSDHLMLDERVQATLMQENCWLSN